MTEKETLPPPLVELEDEIKTIEVTLPESKHHKKQLVRQTDSSRKDTIRSLILGTDESLESDHETSFIHLPSTKPLPMVEEKKLPSLQNKPLPVVEEKKLPSLLTESKPVLRSIIDPPVDKTIQPETVKPLLNSINANSSLPKNTDFDNADREMEKIPSKKKFQNDDDDIVTRNPEIPNEDVIRVREYNLDDINPREATSDYGDRICILGLPGSGKSKLILDIAYHKQHIIPVCKIYSGSEKENHFYEKHFPKIFIHHEALENEVHRVKARQTNLMKTRYPWILQIRDDLSYQKTHNDAPIFNELYKNGRHWKLLDIFAMHDPIDMPANQRGEISGSFLYAIPSDEKKRSAHRSFGGAVPLNIFKDLITYITPDHTSLVIRNDCFSANLSDMVAYYKVDLDYLNSLDIQFGCEMAWHYNDLRLEPDSY